MGVSVHLHDISTGEVLQNDEISTNSTLLEVRLLLNIETFQFVFLDKNLQGIRLQREHEVVVSKVALPHRRWMRGETLKHHDHRLLLINSRSEICYHSNFTNRNNAHSMAYNNKVIDKSIVLKDVVTPDVYGISPLEYACLHKRYNFLNQIFEKFGSSLTDQLSIRLVRLIISTGVVSESFSRQLSLIGRRFPAHLLSDSPKALLYWHRTAPELIEWNSRIAFFTFVESIKCVLECCPVESYPAEKAFIFNLEEHNIVGMFYVLFIFFFCCKLNNA